MFEAFRLKPGGIGIGGVGIVHEHLQYREITARWFGLGQVEL